MLDGGGRTQFRTRGAVRKASVAQGAMEAPQTLGAGGQFLRAAHVTDPGVPQFDEVGGGQPQGLVVVQAEPLRPQRRVLAQQLDVGCAFE